MTHLVSIVVPSYGGGTFLQRTVDSILAQTYPNIEVVVVDDNGIGTEAQLKTAEKMEKYAKLENVKYICHEKNKNGSAARNTGVKHSKGEYIGLLDDDDVYTVDNIKTQVAVLDSLSEEYALTYCSNERYLGDVKVGESHVTHSGSVLYEVLTHRVTIGSSALLIRRSVWEELGGFDESFWRHQDWEFTARVAARYQVKAVDFLGFIRYLEFRNDPKSLAKVHEYREHYLAKMKPLIDTLPKKKQRDVYVYNRLDAAVQHLKKRDIKGFLQAYCAAKPGWRGVRMMFGRVWAFLKKKCGKKQRI